KYISCHPLGLQYRLGRRTGRRVCGQSGGSVLDRGVEQRGGLLVASGRSVYPSLDVGILPRIKREQATGGCPQRCSTESLKRSYLRPSLSLVGILALRGL